VDQNTLIQPGQPPSNIDESSLRSLFLEEHAAVAPPPGGHQPKPAVAPAELSAPARGHPRRNSPGPCTRPRISAPAGARHCSAAPYTSPRTQAPSRDRWWPPAAVPTGALHHGHVRRREYAAFPAPLPKRAAGRGLEVVVDQPIRRRPRAGRVARHRRRSIHAGAVRNCHDLRCKER
jgi:hypothetical protein